MKARKLLVLDTSFCLEAILARGLEKSVTCRDLDGYFEHVWSVHPFATLVSSPDWGPASGPPVTLQMGERHTFIDAKVGFTPLLEKFPALNFLLSQLFLLVLLSRLIVREGISVIRAGDPLYLGVMGWLLSRITGIPLVVRVGANNGKIRETTGRAIMPRLFRKPQTEEAVERFVLSRCDLVAGANQDNLRYAMECGADPAKCTLFRYGNLIDPGHFLAPSQRAAAGKKLPESPFLMYVGRLEPVKKADHVIRVFARVLATVGQYKLLLVGDGSERGKLEKLAQELGVQRHVVFCGNRDQQWLCSMIPHAQVVLSPHTGRALTEAALGAAPIAAYDIDWQSELIKPGLTGELVEFGDWEALADATVKLLKDREYAERTGRKVRKLALDMMDQERLNRHECSEYDLLLKRHSKGFRRQGHDHPLAPDPALPTTPPPSGGRSGGGKGVDLKAVVTLTDPSGPPPTVGGPTAVEGGDVG